MVHGFPKEHLHHLHLVSQSFIPTLPFCLPFYKTMPYTDGKQARVCCRNSKEPREVSGTYIFWLLEDGSDLCPVSWPLKAPVEFVSLHALNTRCTRRYTALA